MIVSTTHKFVFLSNRKCASSSLVHSLEPYAALIAQKNPKLRHTSFREYKRFIEPYIAHMTGEDVSAYKVFCLFREPTEWLFSWYRFRQRREISPEVQPGHWEYTGDMSWRAFLDAYFAKKRPPFARVGSQADFVLDEDGRPGDIELYRFDRIDQFVADMSRHIGEELNLVKYNVSPTIDRGLADDDYAYCRERLVPEYKIFDALG